jgi:uncharacterized membrane protein YjgN (DUF898 family)
MDQTTATAPRPAFQYDGDIGELYAIFLINLMLTIVTLGIFRFWAITRYRRYLWSHMRFQNENFEYTGRGRDLFLGLLMAIGILVGLAVVAGLLSALLSKIDRGLGALPMVALYVTIVTLAFAARFSAQRYRLSRTVWCGIRGGMQGSALRYGVRNLLYAVMVPFTLFQLVPWMQVRLAERRINASRFGNLAFAFRGRAVWLYLPYLAVFVGSALLFALIAGVLWAEVAPSISPLIGSGAKDPRLLAAIERATLLVIAGMILFGIGSGLIGCWYWARLGRHILGNTTLGPLRLSSAVTGPALLWLVLGNALIALFTFGFGLPVVVHRSARFLARTLLVTGTLDAATLQQGALAMPRTGEGMLQMLDHGSIF